MLSLVSDVLLSFKWAPAMQRDGKLLILQLKTPPTICHSTLNNRTTDRSSEVIGRCRERTADFLSFILSPFEKPCWDTGYAVCAQGIISDHNLEIMKECCCSPTANERNIIKCQGAVWLLEQKTRGSWSLLYSCLYYYLSWVILKKVGVEWWAEVEIRTSICS